MTVSCVQCGQENNPQYRFCGMCGAPLGSPPAAIPSDAVRERVRVPVSGPSFLGLGDERSRDLDYLLEDEPPKGHGRLYLALLLLVISAGLLAWQFQRDGYPWLGYLLKPAASSRPAVSSPPVQAPDSAAAAAPAAPVEATANPAPPEVQPVKSEALAPSAADPAGSSASANPSAAAKTSEPLAAQPQAPQSDDGPEATAKATDAGSPPASEADAGEPVPKEVAAATATPLEKPASRKPSPAVPANSFEDRLVADGERYLYGRGVPQDCERAQRNLQIGARQSNARAQTLLGAMYATGHCVSRDLPTAYRWFAKALHGDPANSRVQQDLEVLWKQMTPEERQLAIKGQ
jgi:TPR repeat protein